MASRSRRLPFDSLTTITGHNLFICAYHGFAQLGRWREATWVYAFFIAEENCKEDGLVTVVILEYVSIWNLDLQEYKAYCKYTLIDTVTGYRNLAQDLAFGLQISGSQAVFYN